MCIGFGACPDEACAGNQRLPPNVTGFEVWQDCMEFCPNN
jgi:hypothetical protein